MDLADGSFAVQRAKARVAAVSIDAMRFRHLVSLGDEVSCYCSLERTGETSVSSGLISSGPA